MPQQQGPPVGADVSALMPVGSDVSHLMGGAPPAATWKPAATEDYLPQPKSFLESAINFASSFAHNVDPRPALKVLYDATTGFGGMLSGDITRADAFAADLKQIGTAQLEQFKKAKQAYQNGRLSEAVGLTLAGAMPLLGPAAANAGEQIGSGDLSGGAGSAAGILAPMAAAKLIPKSVGVPAYARNQSPEAAAAVKFGQQHGIPIDAATATGSQVIANVQKRVGDSMGGANIAEDFKARQAKGLATVGEQLAAKANQGGPAVTPQQAGQGIRDAVYKRLQEFAGEADTAYEAIRQVESQPQSLQRVQVGTMKDPRTGAVTPVMEDVPLPVDLRSAKAALKPILDRLVRQMPVTQQQASKGLKALENIVNGPDAAPLTQVDADLGAIKTIARADIPEMRNVSQGLAAHAVAQLDAAVRSTAQRAGVLDKLEAGRKATIAKYGADDVLTEIRHEPVQAFTQATARQDSGIARLRQVAKLAPAELPRIGRAVLDDFMETATADGGFQHAQKIRATWNKLGGETKALLFKDPDYIADLDKFFRLAEKIAENPNPSGTARINNIFNATSTLVGYPAAKLLYSPAGVKLLTEGFRIPLTSPAAVANYSARLTAALRNAAAMDPVMADDRQAMPPTGSVRR